MNYRNKAPCCLSVITTVSNGLLVGGGGVGMGQRGGGVLKAARGLICSAVKWFSVSSSDIASVCAGGISDLRVIKIWAHSTRGLCTWSLHRAVSNRSDCGADDLDTSILSLIGRLSHYFSHLSQSFAALLFLRGSNTQLYLYQVVPRKDFL